MIMYKEIQIILNYLNRFRKIRFTALVRSGSRILKSLLKSYTTTRRSNTIGL